MPGFKAKVIKPFQQVITIGKSSGDKHSITFVSNSPTLIWAIDKHMLDKRGAEEANTRAVQQSAHGTRHCMHLSDCLEQQEPDQAIKAAACGEVSPYGALHTQRFQELTRRTDVMEASQWCVR